MTVWVAILFVAGIGLILSEFFLPGMVAGVIGSMLIVGSCALGISANPEAAIIIIPAELGGVVVTVALGMYVLSRTRVAKGLILESNQAGYSAHDTDASLLGVEGTVHTALRPAGTILVNGRRIDAVSDGSFIEENARVRVIEVHGSRVVVERAA